MTWFPAFAAMIVSQKWPMRFLALSLLCLLSACSSPPRTWSYQFEHGKTAIARGPHALPPSKLPTRVKAAIHAGNRLVGKPYKFGGGHRSFHDNGYDCSGAVSYVLAGAGLLNAPTTSSALRRYGRSGKGKYITIYTRDGHCFAEVAGLRFDTGYNGPGDGPQWTTRSRPLKGFKARHPPGF